MEEGLAKDTISAATDLDDRVASIINICELGSTICDSAVDPDDVPCRV